MSKPMFDYLVVVCGGAGENVFENEWTIKAKNITEALGIASGAIENYDMTIVSIEQVD
ncbi:hypothetical protein LCGC14_0394510 [marine sediment metagenome]|uniref:Uncharacterized protein n=1 Tax=marine sediment metagenome TaxID=412755 RepID=A0A0F9VKT1_9ZZZZ